MGKRIGIMGGTFDPPHVGHLILGEVARQQLALDLVMFMPAGQPPHKRTEPMSAVQHRLAMTRLAVAGNGAFTVNTIDIERPAPHYTSTLRPLLQEAFPDSDFALLIGGDSLRDLPRWHEPHRVASQWQLAVLSRPGFDVDWTALEKAVPGVGQATTMLDGPSIALSSTQVRRWANAGRSLRYLMPAAVAGYIKENGLYSSGRYQDAAASSPSEVPATGPA